MVNTARNFLIKLNSLQQMHLKLLQKKKKTIQKTAEATSDLIGNKIVERITKVSKTSQQNNSETVTNKHDKEIYKDKEDIYLLKKDTTLLMI